MNTQIYPVTIELTGRQYQKLHAAASKRSVEIHDLVEQLVDRSLMPMSGRLYEAAHRELSVRQLWGMGLNDRQIAREIHCHPTTVFRTRQRLGLAANDPRGGNHHHKGA